MDTIYYSLLLVLSLAFILIGFLRSQIDKKNPDGLISEKETANKWFAENTWSARFSILFLPLIFLYNALVWLVFGISSLFDFISFVFKKLWWLILFIWREVFNPTIFWAATLIWHYPIGFSWRFFEFSFKHISISLKQSSIIFAIKKLLKIGLLGSILSIVYFIYPNIVSLFIGTILFVLYFQLLVFQSISNFRQEFPEQKNKPSFKIVLMWLGIALLLAGILAGITLLDNYAISALGVALSQILIPVLILVSIAFISAATCLAPYFQNKHNINTLDFLKALLYRLPKLIFAQPFQLLGVSIVGIIPLFVVLTLNKGTSIVTGKDFIQWKDEVKTLDEHLPAYNQARIDIQTNNVNINDLLIDKESGLANYNLLLTNLENQITNAEALKNQIQKDKIHTFFGDAYVGEEQFFSIPEISNCAEYKWVVEKDGNKIYEKSLYAETDGKSSVFYYRWTTPGQYTILLTPTNRCGNSETIRTFVNVLEIQQKAEISRPIGKTQVCENEEVTYKTDKGYDSYEWNHPFGNSITSVEQLTLTWGNISGSILVRGVSSNGSKTLWRGTDVFVTSMPFSKNVEKKILNDENQIELNITKDFIFTTIEEAQDSLNKLVLLKDNLTEEMNNFISQIENKIQYLNNNNETLRSSIWGNFYIILCKIMAALGLVLAVSLLLSTIFTYLLLFHYDLFNYMQEGKHYWQETLYKIRLQNPQQPLLGIFILLVALGLISLLI